ncbi:hypothetical protein Gasu2_59270 [Galdieria sulphuraria]|nr:hypothetical protein Gasu2_59270 [Galdieria sulphuraria]
MKSYEDRDETMSCTEVSQPNNRCYHHSPFIQQRVEPSLTSNHSCDIWEEEKNSPWLYSTEQLTYSSVLFQRRLSQQWMNSSTPPPPPPSPSLSCPHPTIQLVNKKTPCTYQMSYLIVYMCASATLLATGIWCWVTLPSSKLLELKWNTLYTLLLRHSNIVAIVMGGFLLLWIFVMGMWLANKSYKLWVKISYWIWLFFTCCLTTSFGIMNCFIMSYSVLSHSGENMWKRMISNGQESILCNIQQHYYCQGWNSQVDETLSCSSSTPLLFLWYP